MDENAEGRDGAIRAADVMAIVLTFDARAALARCLDAVRAQSVAPSTVLVIDNASAELVDDLVATVPGGRVLRTLRNGGPAGGHAAGLRAFLRSGHAFAWVLDDDCVPHPGALEALLATAEAETGARAPLVHPCVVDADTDEHLEGRGWWGVLVAREIVEFVGVPNEALVWWTEDTEYLQWRIPGAGFPVVWSDNATVGVGRTRAAGSKPAWKFYYEARNQVYHRLWVQRPHGLWPVPRHLTLYVRWRRAWHSVWRLAVRAVAGERSGRARELTMVARGAVDGVWGRLGETVPIGAADRPEIGQSSGG